MKAKCCLDPSLPFNVFEILAMSSASQCSQVVCGCKNWCIVPVLVTGMFFLSDLIFGIKS